MFCHFVFEQIFSIGFFSAWECSCFGILDDSSNTSTWY